MTHSSMIHLSSSSLLLAMVGLSGCATVADMSASMLGPNAVEKVQHRRQAKEIKGVSDSGDQARAEQMCAEGVDKNQLALKKDLHSEICASHATMVRTTLNTSKDIKGARKMCEEGKGTAGFDLTGSTRAEVCTTYASMMTGHIKQLSCQEFVGLQPSFLKFSETAELTKASKGRMVECEDEFAQAKAKVEAEKRAAVLAQLSSKGSREEYGKICKERPYAESLGLDEESRALVCDEYVLRSVEGIEQADCAGYNDVASAMHDEVGKVTGSDRVARVDDAWLGRAMTCKDWAGFFGKYVPAVERSYPRDRALKLFNKIYEEDGTLAGESFTLVDSKPFIEKLDQGGRLNFTYTMVSFSEKHAEAGSCKTFGKLLTMLDVRQGKHYVLEYLTRNECTGYRDDVEKLLISDYELEREGACYYLAKFGDKGSIKKMQTLSYTDSYTYKYAYPVRQACRDSYGKLELKLSN